MIIEVMVAILLLTVGIVATFQTFDSSSHLTLTTQRQQAAMTAAEQAIEQIRAMPYANVAMSTPLPTHTTDGNASTDTSGNPSNPNYWVSGSNLKIVTNFNQESSSTLGGVSSTGEPMVSVSGGAVSPGPTTVSTNGYSASVYRYVTYVNDSCVYLLVDLCPGTQDAKRITIAVVLQAGQATAGVEKPVWLTTVVANPQAGVSG